MTGTCPLSLTLRVVTPHEVTLENLHVHIITVNKKIKYFTRHRWSNKLLVVMETKQIRVIVAIHHIITSSQSTDQSTLCEESLSLIYARYVHPWCDSRGTEPSPPRSWMPVCSAAPPAGACTHHDIPSRHLPISAIHIINNHWITRSRDLRLANQNWERDAANIIHELVTRHKLISSKKTTNRKLGSAGERYRWVLRLHLNDGRDGRMFVRSIGRLFQIIRTCMTEGTTSEHRPTSCRSYVG